MTQLSEGDWLQIPVPDNAFPVHISIDGNERQPAWIDRTPGYVAQIRLPALRRGRHGAVAYASGQTYQVEFEVV
jgi:hypothetical protein